MAKMHPWLVSAELVEVLKDSDCSLDESKAILADAYSEYERKLEAAWQDQQDALVESGGPDDSAYRRGLINAGRGHLLGGR